MLEFAGRFSNPDLMIKQGKYWSVIYRDGTVTLGNCILICNRKCPTLGELRPEEMEEFPVLCKWYEDKIKSLFGAVKFNYLALMMKDEFVHFHIIPRYDHDVEKYGIVWKDKDFPKPPSLDVIDVDKQIVELVKKDLRG